MKICTKCGESKPLDMFYRNKTGRDGRKARCKTCVLARQAEHNARPEVKAHAAEYYTEQRDRIREQQAEYYAENKEGILARQAEYNQAHPEVRWESTFRTRSEAYGFEPVIESFTRDDLIARWGDECWHCKGEWSELDHHPVPVAHGGEHSLQNCRPSCVPCNRPGGRISRLNKKDVGETA